MTNSNKPQPDTTITSEVPEPTIDWLIDQIAPNPGNSPLLNFNKDRLKHLIAQEANKARIDELEHVSDPGEGVWLNFDPEINPITREERIAQLTADKEQNG